MRVWATFPPDVHSHNPLYFDNYAYGNGKRVFDTGDTWLRLNQNNDFSSGIHTPYFLNAGSLAVGGYYASPGGGSIAYAGNVMPYRNGALYTGYVYVPLITMLENGSWSAVSKGTADTGWLNVTSVFGVPSGCSAVMVRLGVVSATTNLVARVGTSAIIPNDRQVAAATFAANVPTTVVGTVAVVSNQIYVSFSGTITQVSLGIIGYYL